MISFLRLIRRNLIQSNSLRKYLFYALGEITLVVIGILIALGINNWNESRNKRVHEIELLKSFKTELSAHNTRIDEIRAFNQYVLRASEELIDILENRTPYQPRFDSLFFSATCFTFGDQLSSASLDNLKSVGVDIISNQQLRNELILVFDKFSYIKEAQEIYKQLIIDAGTQVMSTRFDELWQGDTESFAPSGVMHPLNFQNLFEDDEYLFFLRSVPNNLQWFVFKPCDYTQKAINEVLKSIDDELGIIDV